MIQGTFEWWSAAPSGPGATMVASVATLGLPVANCGKPAPRRADGEPGHDDFPDRGVAMRFTSMTAHRQPGAFNLGGAADVVDNCGTPWIHNESDATITRKGAVLPTLRSPSTTTAP